MAGKLDVLAKYYPHSWDIILGYYPHSVHLSEHITVLGAIGFNTIFIWDPSNIETAW